MDCTKVDLKKGSTGAQVKELQKYLIFTRCYDGNIDGEYGDYTVKAVKKLQKMYSVTEDGEFGKKTCKACGINGQDISNSIQAVEVDQFLNMVSRYETYVKENKKEPNICYIDISTKYRYVTKEKYLDMKKRYDAYVKEKGTKPKVCYINLPTSDLTTATTEDGSTTTVSTSNIVTKMKDAIGDFSNYKEAYNLLRGRGYIGYNNDIYDQETAIKRLKNKQGLNCSDSCQLMYALAEALGITVRYRHVKCKTGTGHIQLDVKYPIGTTSWTTIDPAAALSTGSQYQWGKVWCANATLLSYNDAWLMSDDGKT